MRRRRSYALACLLALAGATAHAAPGELTLTLDPKGVSPGDAASLRVFLDETRQLLPERVRRALARDVSVRFAPLKGADSPLVPPVEPGTTPDPARPVSVLGQAQVDNVFAGKGRIATVLLNRKLLPVILKGPSERVDFSWGHRSFYRLAQATLLHELGHVYDFANFRSAQENEAYRSCAAERARYDRPSASGKGGAAPAWPNRARCRKVLQRSRTVSQDGEFLLLTGFVQRGILLPRRAQEARLSVDVEGENPYLAQSPDNYEFLNADEAFAVNFEYFLLDPEFACRRPTLHHYYSQRFGDPHRSERDCRVNTRAPLFSNHADGKARFRDLDPARLYEVHYLFASQGRAAMSRFGHAMFRLVFCAKGTPMGPDCLQDRGEHVVVSYRASINEPTINSMKGLNGEYPSQLFLLSLADVVNEYTVGEFRDLESYPLKLSAEAKKLFLLRVLEQLWSYQGSYKFLSNNCATESLKVVQATSENAGLRESAVISPLGVRAALDREGLSDLSVLEPKDRALEAGYLFASYYESLERHYATLIGLGLRSDAKDAADYVARSTAAERRKSYDAKVASLSEGKKSAWVLATFAIEDYIRKDRSLKLLQQVGKVLAKDYASKKPGPETAKIRNVVEKVMEIQKRSPLHEGLKAGYGIPLVADFGGASSEVIEEKRKALINEAMSSLMEEVLSLAPDQVQELRAVENSVALIRADLYRFVH